MLPINPKTMKTTSMIVRRRPARTALATNNSCLPMAWPFSVGYGPRLTYEPTGRQERVRHGVLTNPFREGRCRKVQPQRVLWLWENER